MKVKGKVYSLTFTELFSMFVTDVSYRRCADMLDRGLNRPEGEGFSFRTLKDLALRIGSGIDAAMENEAEEILSVHGFDPDTGLPLDPEFLDKSVTEPIVPVAPGFSDDEKKKVLEKYNSLFANDDDGHNRLMDDGVSIGCERSPSTCVYISVDDIGVKCQKESRKDGYTKEFKTVRNTVIHISCGSKSYVITAYGMEKAFRLLMAFLLRNDLMRDREIVFLTDGAKDIKGCIEKFFGFRPYTIYLDWYHVAKKCREYISQAIKGTADSKKAIIQKVFKLLWRRRIEDIVTYIDGFGINSVKCEEKRAEMKDYLERKKEYIPCYAFRKQMNLVNASNRVEKANDIVVGRREKHNGMSWVPEGSSCLAVMKAAIFNGEKNVWMNSKVFHFSLVDRKVA